MYGKALLLRSAPSRTGARTSRTRGPATFTAAYPAVTFTTWTQVCRTAPHHFSHCSTNCTLPDEVVMKYAFSETRVTVPSSRMTPESSQSTPYRVRPGLRSENRCV